MFSRILTTCGLLFFKVSSALDPSYFNFEELDYSDSLHREIMDIFMDSPHTTSLRSVGLIGDNLNEFILPIKRLHENDTAVVMGQKEPTFVHSSFVEINCRQDESSGETLDDILPLVTASYTVVVILTDPQVLFFHEIEACMLGAFEKFWEKQMMNVVIMFSSDYKTSVKSSPSPSKVLAYVYEPYNEEPLRNVTGMGFHEVFYDKSANLHLHPLKVLAYEKATSATANVSGIVQPSKIDGSLTKILGRIYNATAIVNYCTEPDEEFGNLDYIEHVEELKNGSIDIWMNVGLLRPEILGEIIHTYPQRDLDVICVLPSYTDEQVKYKSISGGRVRYLLLMMVVLLSVISFVVFLSSTILLQNIPLSKLAKVVINQSDVITQKISSTTIRILFGTWLAVSLVYSTSLQTFITSRIIRPSVGEKMTTIQEVMESEIRLRTEQTHWRITKNLYPVEFFKKLENRMDVVTNNDLFAAQGPDIGYLTTKDVAELINKEKSNVYVLRETFLPNLVAYYFSKKSLLIHRFNKISTSITETGILQKWSADNHRQLINDLRIVKIVAPVKYITYKHLKSAVYAYGIGVFFAFIVFICEIKWH